MAGKKVIFVPITMGITLTEGWARRMKEHAAMHGYSFDIRDAAFNTGAMSELLAKAISDKPDVLVVHNPTVQLLARQIKQAEAAGHQGAADQPAVQPAVRRLRRRQLDAHRHRDRARTSSRNAAPAAAKSGKVAIIPGQLTAADSVMMNEAAFKVFKDHPEIKVVSNQASDWEPEKARQITATVLQQNPDLCAIFGHWDVHTIGAGNAVKDAGLSGKVLVYATGGGEQGEACKAIENGTCSTGVEL